MKLRRLLKKASDIASLPPGCQQREALLAEFVDQFHTLVTGEAGWCTDPSCRLPLSCRCCSSGPSRYLCLLYLLVKSLYVLNVGLQFLLLGKWLASLFVLFIAFSSCPIVLAINSACSQSEQARSWVEVFYGTVLNSFVD